MFDVDIVAGPFATRDAPVSLNGVVIMVGTDLAGGNERLKLVVVVEGAVTVVSGIVTVISDTVTVIVRLCSVEGGEPPGPGGIVDGTDGTTVDDNRDMLDIATGEPADNGGCSGAALAGPVRIGGWTAGFETEYADGNEVMLELDWPQTGTMPPVFVLEGVPLVVVRVIVMQMVVVVLQAVTVVVQGVKETLSGSVPLTTSLSC